MLFTNRDFEIIEAPYFKAVRNAPPAYPQAMCEIRQYDEIKVGPHL